MKMVEQNISGVKLERLRQNAVKKHKILRKLFPVCLILFIGLTLVQSRFMFEDEMVEAHINRFIKVLKDRI